MTIVELLIVIGIILIMAAIMLPALQMVRETSRETTCRNNLKQLGQAYIKAMKLGPDQLDLRDEASWPKSLLQYLDDVEVFHCPQHTGAQVSAATLNDGDHGHANLLLSSGAGIAQAGEIAISYGINNRADLLMTSEKIVMVDYGRTVVNVVGSQSAENENWRTKYDDWYTLMAPRHRGRLNVLYRSGMVDASLPNDIDPIHCYSYHRYWKPSRSAAFNRECVDEAGVVVADYLRPEVSADGNLDEADQGADDGDAGDDADDPSQKAVDEGLIWLILHQMGNGGWTLKHHMGGTPPCAGRCPDESIVDKPCTGVATGLALLCFLGNGNGPGHGDYKKTVAKGVNFLIRQVQPNGYIGTCTPRAGGYEPAFALMALVEAMRSGSIHGSWGSVNPRRLWDASFRALNYIAHCEFPSGGFRYSCGVYPDTSVTAAMLQSLKSSEEARFPIPDLAGISDRLHNWLDLCQDLDSHYPGNVVQDDQFAGTRFHNLGIRYGYQPPDRHADSFAMWAAGGYLRLYLNPELRYHTAIESLAKEFHKRMTDAGRPDPDRYFNFYAHHFMRMVGDDTGAGAVWSDWSETMEKYLIETRETQGHPRGSWYENSQWNPHLGRLGVTCLSLLSLKAYYEQIKLTSTN